ncbi:MAG: arylsulfatase [Planctomycetaceae bacterium]
MVTLLLSFAWFGTQSDASQPHVLLIMADDMGYGDPGCYNSDSKIPTPHIDRLAAEGMRFTDAHAPAAVCVPTRYGLMTGRYPFRMPDVERGRPKIAEGRTTIASLLADNGYHTAMVGKWHLGFDFDDMAGKHRGGPVDRGFHSYFGIPASLDIPPYYFIRDDQPVSAPTETIAAHDSDGWTKIQGAFWREGGIAPGFRHADVLPRFTEEAIRVIDRHAEERPEAPLFLYFALPAPHTPWLPADLYQGKSGAGMYGDFVVQVDDCIGRVLEAFDRHGMTDDTLVVFTSDNGPVWYPHDAERFSHRSVGPLRGMKGDAYEGGHRMPFLVRWPGKVASGSVSDETICHVDVLRTLAGVIGVDLPDGEGADSHNLLPVLLGESDHPVRTTLISESSKKVLAIRAGPWKLIPTRGSGGFTQTSTGPDESEGQLYRLDSELGETTNLWAKHPEMVERLTRQLAEVQSGDRTAP